MDLLAEVLALRLGRVPVRVHSSLSLGRRTSKRLRFSIVGSLTRLVLGGRGARVTLERLEPGLDAQLRLNELLEELANRRQLVIHGFFRPAP